jgi:hypothetical protein
MPVTAANLIVGNAKITVDAVDVGAIKEGITITPQFETFTVDIEQELMPSRFWYVGKKYSVEFTMCEPTLANMKIAWDNPNTATGTSPSPKTLAFGTVNAADFVPTNRVITATSFVPGGSLVRTVTFYKCILEGPGSTTFSKRQEVNMKCTFNCAYDDSSSKVGQFSDAQV